jgi:hypothetical protein
MALTANHAAARERWRADLNELEAHVLHNGGLAGAPDKEKEAGLRRGYADLIEEREKAKVEFAAEMRAAHARREAAGGTHVREFIERQEVVDHFRTVDQLLLDTRRAWRGIDAVLNGQIGRDVRVIKMFKELGISETRAPVIAVRHPAWTLDNWAEPSDEELLP